MSATARRRISRMLLTLALLFAVLPLTAARPSGKLQSLITASQACYATSGFTWATVRCIADAYHEIYG